MSHEEPRVHAQEELLPFLLNPKSYPHQPRHVRLVQTHASFVFIAPPFVYKIKKPVNFGFLNFSTLERRRYFCEREVQLNRRLCPDMYLGVVPIVRLANGFAFGKEGEVIEYAVQMRKLSDNAFMDKLLKRNAVSANDLSRIVTKLKRFYETHRPNEEIEKWGRIRRLKISTDENFRQAESFVGQTISRAALDAIRFYTNEFYRKRRGWFAKRVRDRWIRDCHGDLHLEHIHITARTLHIYDCIEFNDRLRYVDLASDVAFLAMDLDHEGRPELARQFVAGMSAALRDPAMLHGMNFLKCYRAFVRGKVESLHSVAPAAPEAERSASAERARRYFRLALNYALGDAKPVALVIMGRIASGKSTLARLLAQELGWHVFSSDRIRKESAGFPLFERTSAAAHQRLYSLSATEQTYRKLMNLALAEVRGGRGAILDATFARREQRDALRRRFESAGATFCIIEVNAGDVAIRRRLGERERKQDEISDARLDDFENLTSIYEPPRRAENVFSVKTTTASVTTVRTALLQLVRDHLSRIHRAPTAQRQRHRARKMRAQFASRPKR